MIFDDEIEEERIEEEVEIEEEVGGEEEEVEE